MRKDQRSQEVDVDVDYVQQRFGYNQPSSKPTNLPVNRGRGRRGNSRGNGNRRGTPPNRAQTNQILPCKFCLQNHFRGRVHCSAWDNNCSACNQPNHVKGSVVCRMTKQMNNIEKEDGGISALFLGALNTHSTEENTIPSYEIHIPTGYGSEIHFRIDTGADVSAISSKVWSHT